MCVSVWQVLELVQRLLQEDKMATQREVYYCLVNHFKDQAEFNNTLQGKTHTHMFQLRERGMCVEEVCMYNVCV